MRKVDRNPAKVSGEKICFLGNDRDYAETSSLFAMCSRICAHVMNGGGMCVHQAVEAFRQFVGIVPDVGRMHRAFANALTAREAALAESI